MNHYPQIKNEANRLLAKENHKKYGFFTFVNGLIGKFSIISATKIEDKIQVLYMHESELKNDFSDMVCGDYFIIKDNILQYYDINTAHFIMSNHDNFIKYFSDTFKVPISTKLSLITKN